MSKKILSEDVKRFIVKSLAVYESPSEVVESVKEKFNITIKRQTAHLYDPTKVAGQDLSEELKTLFEQTRAAFEAAEDIPLLKKVVRVKKLSKYVEAFENMGSIAKAAEMIEQIAKEEGGMFTNRKEIGGIGGGPVVVHSKTLDDWEKDKSARTNQAAAVMEIFEDDAPEN